MNFFPAHKCFNTYVQEKFHLQVGKITVHAYLGHKKAEFVLYFYTYEHLKFHGKLS